MTRAPRPLLEEGSPAGQPVLSLSESTCACEEWQQRVRAKRASAHLSVDAARAESIQLDRVGLAARLVAKERGADGEHRQDAQQEFPVLFCRNFQSTRARMRVSHREARRRAREL